jgi:3-hydroxyacyl-CoA dehydrogenase
VNFPIGPLELGDRNGYDTFLLVLESLTDTLGERFRPTVGLRSMVDAGRLGRKTGRASMSMTNAVRSSEHTDRDRSGVVRRCAADRVL